MGFWFRSDIVVMPATLDVGATEYQTCHVCPLSWILQRGNEVRCCCRVEDHDDLMPIIERQTNKLRELYGDFCMAEIIEYPGTEDRKTLVCEVKIILKIAFNNCEETFG